MVLRVVKSTMYNRFLYHVTGHDLSRRELYGLEETIQNTITAALNLPQTLSKRAVFGATAEGGLQVPDLRTQWCVGAAMRVLECLDIAGPLATRELMKAEFASFGLQDVIGDISLGTLRLRKADGAELLTIPGLGLHRQHQDLTRVFRKEAPTPPSKGTDYRRRFLSPGRYYVPKENPRLFRARLQLAVQEDLAQTSCRDHRSRDPVAAVASRVYSRGPDKRSDNTPEEKKLIGAEDTRAHTRAKLKLREYLHRAGASVRVEQPLRGGRDLMDLVASSAKGGTLYIDFSRTFDSLDGRIREKERRYSGSVPQGARLMSFVTNSAGTAAPKCLNALMGFLKRTSGDALGFTAHDIMADIHEICLQTVKAQLAALRRD